MAILANVLNRIFHKREVAPRQSTGSYESHLYWRIKNAGVHVTPETSMTFSAVYRAISFTSQTLALLPWNVLEAHEVKASDPINWVLAKRPNPEMSPFDFKRLMVANAIAWGNGYAEIEFNNAGIPMHLWPIHPARVTVGRYSETKDLVYRCCDGDGMMVDLPPYKVLHVKNIGSEGIVGYSTIGLAARSIGLAIAAENFSSNLFEKQAIPSGMLTVQKELSSAAAKRLEESFAASYSGARNAGRVVVLEEGMEFKQLTLKPEDLQFIQSRQFSVEEIARWFGLPPHILSDMSRATFNNIEHLSISVVNNAILPWCKEFEEEADYKLLGRRSGDVYTKLNVRGLLRGDNASRADYYTKMLQNGVYSINEVRAMEDMAPIVNGDKHLVPLNQTTLENAGNAQQLPEAEPATVTEVIETKSVQQSRMVKQ